MQPHVVRSEFHDLGLKKATKAQAFTMKMSSLYSIARKRNAAMLRLRYLRFSQPSLALPSVAIQ